MRPIPISAVLFVCFVTVNSSGPHPAAQELQSARGVGDPVALGNFLQALEQDVPYVPNEVLVKFRPGTGPSQVSSVMRMLRVEPRPENHRWIGDTLHMRGAELSDPLRASEALARQPEVLYAQPNYIRSNKSIPNDSGYSAQWHFGAINMPTAWDINPGARSEVVIAVVDTGLTTVTNSYSFRIWDGGAFRLFSVPLSKAADFDHTRVQPGREFVSGWRWVAPSGEQILFDADGHGTHVAGTIAQQTNNNAGYAGIAYQSTILPLKVCWSYWDVQLFFGAQGVPGFVDADAGGCPDSAHAEAIRFAADNGAKVINISIGGEGPAPAIRDALQYAVSRGAFVAIAAGNEAESGNPTVYPAAYASTISGVIAVGAVNRQLKRASYSSFGTFVEIAAPGGGDGPDADEVWQMGPRQDDLRFLLLSPRFDRYEPYGISGTSMAAPHVSGVAALLYSQGITNPAAIEAALKRFARDLGPAGVDPEFGAGLIDARASLRGMGAAR